MNAHFIRVRSHYMNKDSDEVLKFNGIDVLIKIINERSGEVGRVQ